MAGGQKRGRTQRRHFKQSKDNVWKYNDNKKGKPADGVSPPNATADPNSDANPNSNLTWLPFVAENQAFEEYYKEQCIVPVEEWDEFMRILRSPLPAAFRINSSGQFFQDIRSQLEKDFRKSVEADITNENEVEAIRPLPWYPGNLAWHLNFSRMQLRKNQTLERFHEFLKRENEIGNITRQEAVSMVPPLFLDVHPDHFVLDMCAAPGSKTFQLLELMHHAAETGTLPSGMVMANDVDVQRCNLLIHQTKRMCCSNLIVTNHDAQHFPSCHLERNCIEACNRTAANVSEESMTNQTSTFQDSEELMCSQLLFDRVLCDVPCSGDGTLRKAPDIWRKWHSGMGNGLHSLQVQIAMRGLALLKVGGRMVYSTCSMNPVEDEAVISEVLTRCGESVKLLDVSSELPGLSRHHGLKKWKVRDKGLWLSLYKDVPDSRRSTILPSMFPGGKNSSASVAHVQVGKDTTEQPNNDVNSICTEEISHLPLERCMRILPHDQNSGAFFIAVLQKLSPLPVLPQKSHNNGRNISNRKKEIQKNISEGINKEEKQISENVQEQCLDAAGTDANLAQEPLASKEEVSAETNSTIDDENVKKDRAGKDRQEGDQRTKGGLQIQGKWRGVDPVLFYDNVASIQSISAFYGISKSFPLDGHLSSRNEDSDRVKRIYYISKSVQDVLKLNFRVGQKLKIASIGLKLFERQSSKDGSTCAFRISSEGLPLILPHISKQILHASLADFQHLLQYRNVKFPDLVDANFRENASKLLAGCCVVVLERGHQPFDSTPPDAPEIAIVCWKGKNSLSIMVSETDGHELLERISVRFGLGKAATAEDKGTNVSSETVPHPVDCESEIKMEEVKDESVAVEEKD